ncbi:MAG: hypothetical protein ACI4S2_07680 [Lachnospiraceae bacterium]
MKNHCSRFITVLCVILIFSLVGCQSKKGISSENGTSDSNTEFLTDHEWVHYTICNETISFHDDGSFSFYCACGSPVGNYDLFDSYKYNEETSEITLLPEDDDNIIKILRYEKSRLLLKCSDGIKEFFDNTDPLVSNSYTDDAYDTENYTLGFSSYIAIVNKNGDSLTSAPSCYDADVPEYKDYLLEEKLADNITYGEWDMQVTQTEEGEEIKHSYKELSDEQVNKMLEGGPSSGYVWYNNNAEIEKIVFFGKTVIQQ